MPGFFIDSRFFAPATGFRLVEALLIMGLRPAKFLV